MSDSSQILQDLSTVADTILRYKEAIIISHMNPDADAFGSSCGLASGLRNLGIVCTVYNESGSIARYSVIPGVLAVNKTLPPSVAEGTVVIVCDCGAAERVGDSYLPFVKGAPFVINIDHHNKNSLFGTLNLVVESASSTSEIVYDLLSAMQLRIQQEGAISKDVAVALMAGIIGDTGSFRYPSTSPKTFLVAHDLYVRGAKPSEIVQELFGSVTLPALRLQSEALSRIQLYSDGRFAEVLVTAEMISRVGAELLDADSLAERGRDVQGVCVSALFKQDGDIWRVSLRSRSPQWDVSVVARHFGGGGHKAAAAFRWGSDLESLQSELRVKIQEVLDSPSEESSSG